MLRPWTSDRRAGLARRVAVVAGLLTATAAAADGGDGRGLPSFDRAPFVNPRIVRDLASWISDEGDQVVAIDLAGAAGANRYAGDVEVQRAGGGHPRVVFAEPAEPGQRAPFFAYEHLGDTASGVHVLRVSQGTGGTGVFESLLLLRTELEQGCSYDAVRHVFGPDRERTVLRRLGEIPLGDRYGGEITVRGDDVVIPRDAREVASVYWSEDAVVHVVRAARAPALRRANPPKAAASPRGR